MKLLIHLQIKLRHLLKLEKKCCCCKCVITDSLTHDAKVSGDRRRNGEPEGHDRKRDDAPSDGSDAAGSRSEDCDDGKPVPFDELDEVVVPDANAPPDEVEEDAGDEHPDQSSVSQDDLFHPRGFIGNDWWGSCFWNCN